MRVKTLAQKWRRKKVRFLTLNLFSEHEEGEHGVHTTQTSGHWLSGGGVDLWLLHEHEGEEHVGHSSGSGTEPVPEEEERKHRVHTSGASGTSHTAHGHEKKEIRV